MELICTGCFTNPVAAHRSAGHDSAEMLVCSLGAFALHQGISDQDALRCNYCGSTVHLDYHQLVASPMLLTQSRASISARSKSPGARPGSSVRMAATAA